MRTFMALLFAISLTPGCSDDSHTADDAGRPDAVASDGATDAGSPDAATDAEAHDVSADTAKPDASTADGAPTPDLPIADTGVDATSPSPDSAPTPDLSNGFVKALAGTWLIGWAGGLNHYSWLKLTPTSDTDGKAIILDGAKLNANAPYWACSGPTSWNITAKPRTIQLHFPSGSCSGMKSTSLTFGAIKPATGGYPKGALETASVDDSGAPTGLTLTAYRFPVKQCNAALTSCSDPL